MKKYLFPCLFFAALAAANAAMTASPAAAQDLVAAEKRPEQRIEVKLEDAKGAETGSAAVIGMENGLLVRVEVRGMPPGWHAVHFHATGDCSDHADHFKKSGNHLAREGEMHGYLISGGPHAGDLPNIWISDKGEGRAEFHTAYADFALLQDGDGAALMIHAGPDDYGTQPSGDAGDRLACGVIAPGK